jgi:hypothetical protein
MMRPLRLWSSRSAKPGGWRASYRMLIAYAYWTPSEPCRFAGQHIRQKHIYIEGRRREIRREHAWLILHIGEAEYRVGERF